MMKVCHITSVHNRFDTRIFEKQCVSLARNGFDVTLLVNDQFADETSKNVKIISLRNPFNNRFKRILLSKKLFVRLAISVDADIYQFHDPELISMGKELLKRGKIVIFDSHEDVPRQILAKTWIPAPFRKLISFAAETYEKIALKKFNAIVVPTPFLEDRFNKINSKVVQISNFPIISEFAPQRVNDDVDNYVCYIGGISKSRGIEQIAEATKQANMPMVLCGNFVSADLKEDILGKYNHIDYRGQVGRQEVSDVINNALLGLVVLLPTPNHINSYPIKMFEYMAGSIPVVASKFPLWESIVNDAGCGICVDPLDIDEIVKAMKYIADNKGIGREMGAKGRLAVEKKYTWDSQEIKLIKMYKDFLGE